jgi:hypothetical protein
VNISIRTKLLVVAAVAIGGYVAFSPNDSTTAEPTIGNTTASHAHSPRPAQTRRQSATHALLMLAHRVSANTSPTALFASHSWYTPPPPPPAPAPAPGLTAAQEAALNAPVAPPLPFAYMGTYSADGSQPVFFLTQGDRVYNVRVGDTLNDTYSVDSFANGQLVMTYKPLKIKQQMTVGSAQ